MKPTYVCLSTSEIALLLSSDLLPDETASAEQHIAECESCRATIEMMIADSRWWNDAQQSLAASSTRARSETDVFQEAEPTTTEQMLELLGPTDDPEKLGRIAEYEVIGIVGRGGMGVVFKAFDPRLNRFVAIKMLLPHLAASGAARKRFAREGQAAAAVVDDFVLPIYAVAEWRGVPYLVTQYSRGTTLQKRIQSEGPLDVKEILRLGMHTARGLAAAHAQGLVHRDVKPSNILLDGSVERAMLTDFGLARAVDDASITRTGIIAGTPQYMSPEQARGGSVDARSDLFSLGCVLYFLCTGHPAFRADNSYAILRLITDEEPRSIREINPDVPVWLCSIVQKLMAKKAEDRYGSASEVAELLEGCLAHVQQPITTPLPDSLVIQRKFPGALFEHRSTGVFMMIGMIAIAVCGLMFWPSPNPPDISGEWVSNEWGTVVLQLKSPGRYEGTIRNAFHTLGTNPHSDADQQNLIPHLKNSQWKGVHCSMCHEGTSGTIELKWSRDERRFNGDWQTPDQKAAGKLSLLPDGAQINGAWTTKKNSDANQGTPRLAHLVWKRSTKEAETAIEYKPLQSMIESLRADSGSDAECTLTTPPEVTRILLELEIQRGLKQNAICHIFDDHKDSFRIIVEPVYDKRLPVREYPEIGRASLHLLRYKCTVIFSDTPGVEWPLKKEGKPETEITLYVDSDHLHRHAEKNAAANRNSPHAERQKENRIPPASRVVMTIPGINHLKTDLKALIDLASEAEQRQWVNIEAYLDTLSGGIEESRPIEIQHVSSTGDGATLVWVPLPEGDGSFNVFKANLESLGYPLKKQTYDAERCELYRVASHHGGDEYGWVAFNLQNKFACIALTDRIEKMDTLRDQVLASKPPETLIDCSLSIAVINADHSAEAQEYRRRAVQNYRDQTIRNLGTGGSRRLILQLNEWLTSTWLDEYKLLSAEGSIMSARIVLDQSALPSPTAEMKFTASAIPNTALAASLSQLASSKDAYATSQIPESVLFSMCVNAPISELRREKLLSLSDLFTTELRNYLLSLNEENGTGRESAEQLAIGCRQILSDMIESGRCNAIINGSLVDGQSQWIGSLVVPNPRVLAELLPMLHQLQAENDVELNVRKVGNVDIHRIKIGGKLLSLLNSIFKTDGECYVGSDADKIWFACGHNALESLATQIETLGPPKSRADIFHLNARVGTLANPLLKMFEKEVQESRPVDSNDARSQRRMARLLSDMKDSVADEHDQLSIDVRSSSDSVNATIKCDTGILRFFGKQIAGFSSENLE